MRIAILSRQRTLYSTRRIAETGRKRGHDVRILNPDHCLVGVGPEGLNSFVHDGLDIESDLVVPRIGASDTDYALPLLRHLELSGVVCLNRPSGILLSRDKYSASQILAAQGLPVPRTAVTRSPEQVERAIDSVGGPPVILKFQRGTQGVGVMRADTRESVVSIFTAVWSLQQPVMIQEFIQESSGTDLRVFVVGGSARAAMTRHAKSGEFRSNIHLGGSGQSFELTPQLRDVAERAALAFELDIAGVDILLSHNGPRIIEVNSSPGLEGIEKATGVDIAKRIIRHAETRTVSTSNTSSNQTSP